MGYPDPLQGRVRLWAALQGLHRWDGPTALWSAMCLGWFFMLSTFPLKILVVLLTGCSGVRTSNFSPRVKGVLFGMLLL